LSRAAGKAFLAASLLLLLIGVFIGYFFASEKALPSLETTTTTLTVTERSTSVITVTKVEIEMLTTRIEEVFTTTATITKPAAGEVYAVCFPRSMAGCEDLLLDLINRANRSIHVMIYSFTLDDLADALIAAHSRGIEVKVLVEKDNAYIRGSEIEKLIESDVEVALDSNPYLMHHKVMIIDGKIVVTGSYNWSWSAENRNDENIIVIINEEIATKYEEEFNRLWSEAAR